MDTIDSITMIAAAWGLLVLRLTLAFYPVAARDPESAGLVWGRGLGGHLPGLHGKNGHSPFLAKVAMLTEFFRPYLSGAGRIHQNSGSQRYHPHGRSHD